MEENVEENEKERTRKRERSKENLTENVAKRIQQHRRERDNNEKLALRQQWLPDEKESICV